MTSLYRNIIKKALDFVWRAKILWLFGLFATILGNAAEYKSLFNQIERLKDQPKTFQFIAESIVMYGEMFKELGNSSTLGLLALSATLVFILAIALLFIWLAITSQTTIIEATKEYDQDDKKNIAFGKLFKKSFGYFWPVFGLNLLAKFLIFLVLTLLITPLLVTLITIGSGWSTFLTILTVLIFVPLAIIITFVTKYAVSYIVINGQKFWESFVNGWQLFLKNWLISLEMALIVLIINVGLAFVLSFAGLLVLSPIILAGLTSSSANVFFVLLGICLVLLALLFIVAGSIFSAWQNAAWTLLFIKLNNAKVFPKIVRWVAGRIIKKES